MAVLRPYPFRALIDRMLRELPERGSIFDLPRSRFFFGDPGRDLSVRFHDQGASTPLGPAAGPHSQMAQNIVLSWLAGCRVMELKTVQVDDALVIPRPCIDMQTVGYNVEWSQELALPESLEEYVKGSMLIEILRASGQLQLAREADRVIYDMSVGYDLVGIRSERVAAFIRGMQDASSLVEKLRAEIPAEYARFRELDFQTRLSSTLTLSTFHGCPPGEIERMIEFLFEEHGLHCIVKLNPMLLGPERTRELLSGELGYTDVRVPDSAFERDTRWDQAVGLVERLSTRAEALGLGFGVKFSNTLIVENHRDFFPASEKEMYLSGAPLHVLAMNLVQRFRRRFGDRHPISFSAGIDRKNFPDAVALGLVPVTVCSDLLKPGGYGRARGYFDELALRMEGVGAGDVGDFIVRAFGQGGAALERLDLAAGDARRERCRHALAQAHSSLAEAAGEQLYARWVSESLLLNTEHYVPACTSDARYKHEHNSKPPVKIGSSLELFDCVTCDKCIPVCPNDANFAFVLPRLEIPIVKLCREGGSWSSRVEGTLLIAEERQFASFADFCNDCGNCDVFCPEDGGPYLIKPRFFGSLADWRSSTLDGFCFEAGRMHGRIDGREYELASTDGRVSYSGPGFALEFQEHDPLATLSGTASVEVDLTYWHILTWLRDAVYAPSEVNYLSCLT